MPGRPIRHRTAAKWTLKTASTAEEKGSEPSVCRSGQTRLSRERRFPRGGTEGSNSAFSSAESATNLVAAGGVALGWDPEMLWGRRRGDGTIVAVANRWSAPMPQPNDLSRSLVALDQDSTIIAVVEMSQSSWLVAGMLPGIERQPRKKLEPSAERLLGLLHRWRDEAGKAGREITRIALAFEAGCDSIWLARWLEARGVEAHVIHASSVAVSREHRRAKTDRLDTELPKRGVLGWLDRESTRLDFSHLV